MRALALVCLASLAVGTATAADWRLVSDGDLAFVYVDNDSIAPRGRYMRAWVMFDYKQPRKTEKYPYREYRSAKALWAFNCGEQTSATIQDIAFAGDTGRGEIVGSWVVDWDKARFEDVVPDSFSETVLRMACARRPAPAKK